jgi:chloride channel protein, CIC family
MANVFKQLQGVLRPRQLAVLEASLVGLVAGLAAVALKQGVGGLGTVRLGLAEKYPALLVLPLVGGSGGLLAGWLVQRFAPEAAGSGITQVKMALAGIPTALNLRVILVKLLSTGISLGSGMTLGRQGPTVQIGAAIAAQLGRWMPTSPEHRRQLLAAGAAAGLAAGFNAPIAGVLFVVEELLQDVSGLTLGTAILASFVGAVVSRLLGGEAMSLSPQAMNIHPAFSLVMIPWLLVLGILAGALSIGLIRGVVLSLKWHRSALKFIPLAGRVGLAGAVSGLVIALMPTVMRDNASLQMVWITSGLNWQTVLVIFAAKFGLTMLAAGSGAPGGMVAPSLILGSMLGYLVSYGAQAVQSLTGLPFGAEAGVSFTATFALTGMGALFSAVTRSPITAIVLIFELTTDFSLVLPLMIGCVTAYWVGEALASGSLDKALLAANGVVLQPSIPLESQLAQLTAADLMQRQVETLPSSMGLEAAKQAFNQSHHRGFPVVENGELVGIITQGDLTQPYSDLAPTLAQLMTPRPVTVRPYDPLSQVLYLLDRYNISRLPVTEQSKLVGIITRADIIRSEAQHFNANYAPTTLEPSYAVYKTCEPAIGLGRILVPIANPRTAQPLLHLAAALAQERHYELECLHIILVSSSESPAETPVSTLASRRLLEQAMAIGHQWEVPVHTQIRVAQSVASAILETLKERHIDLLMMGWSTGSEALFGSGVDVLVRQVNCALVLAKFADRPTFERWLVPTAGGPNSRQALRLLPGLVNLGEAATVELCHVQSASQSASQNTSQSSKQKRDTKNGQACEVDGDFADRHDPTDSPALTPELQESLAALQNRLSVPVRATALVDGEVAGGIADRAHQTQADVILLGATQEGLLAQVMKGNIPTEIARRCDCTVILVRGAL